MLYHVHALGSELHGAPGAAGLPCELAREGVGPEVTNIGPGRPTGQAPHPARRQGPGVPVILIAGCRNRSFAPGGGGPQPGDPEEERRLFYVGLDQGPTPGLPHPAKSRPFGAEEPGTALSPLAEAAQPVRCRPKGENPGLWTTGPVSRIAANAKYHAAGGGLRGQFFPLSPTNLLALPLPRLCLKPVHSPPAS